MTGLKLSTLGLNEPLKITLVPHKYAAAQLSHEATVQRVPPLNVRVSYALGIVTLFPNLKDKASPTGYEHYYDPRSGQGLINQDFTLLLGEDTSGKFISKWPTFYKPRIISVCKCLRPGPHVDDLLSAQEGSNDYGWDSDLAAILLLVHLLPPTKKGKKFGRISATDATDHVVKFMKLCVAH
uniref:Uncharacterized protein n=1 Tax=Knipowitschia caucasica TaxID=637954 RepID=A0AAV2L8G8_KNICA